MKNLNQRGFAALEGFLIVIALAAIGAAAYFAYQNHQAAPAATEVTRKATVKQLSYSFKLDPTYSFAYPETWKVTSSKDTSDFPSESVTVESPTGLQVKFTDHHGASGRGGACDPDVHNTDFSCPLIDTYSVEKLYKSGSSDVFLVKARYLTSQVSSKAGPQYEMGLQTAVGDYVPKVGSQYGFPYFFNFDPKDDVDITGYAEYPIQSLKNQLDKDKYYQEKDVKDAEAILRSLQTK